MIHKTNSVKQEQMGIFFSKKKKKKMAESSISILTFKTEINARVV